MTDEPIRDLGPDPLAEGSMDEDETPRSEREREEETLEEEEPAGG